MSGEWTGPREGGAAPASWAVFAAGPAGRPSVLEPVPPVKNPRGERWCRSGPRTRALGCPWSVVAGAGSGERPSQRPGVRPPPARARLTGRGRGTADRRWPAGLPSEEQRWGWPGGRGQTREGRKLPGPPLRPSHITGGASREEPPAGHGHGSHVTQLQAHVPVPASGRPGTRLRILGAV